MKSVNQIFGQLTLAKRVRVTAPHYRHFATSLRQTGTNPMRHFVTRTTQFQTRKGLFPNIIQYYSSYH